ncbi:uncharacterized protein L969DRAFT_98390 [Mixia osmundae IAM 14324]|uniref:SAPS-domain-containing protein n=1 Tax=Mixia osmundae (strain CBS 9802 / IAM 14324 / JCM 22182 / KY 12970) TaxID=764103 RepID=G7E666_MIXOS|nr:uncharacterized protein L969DRAFT_98390 [Mixia osmundae IAM 14324]KEI40520.1 hypothetical protein L969DRAFT_98390 [Mixia osmundae IAM 14324]GAA98326.1 hypothetical protein E5Q_05011 [Mixia osmundae IAM 14324]
MAFWRGFAAQSNIETLLSNSLLDSPTPSRTPSSQSSSSSSSTDPAASSVSGESSSLERSQSAESGHRVQALPEHGKQQTGELLTLERLLDEDDFLQECKAGLPKLVEFICKPRVLKRVLAYVSGSALDELDWQERRADAALFGAKPSQTVVEQREAKRLKYPYKCSQILTMDVWAIDNAVLSQPADYLVDFWNAVLDKTSESLADRSVQVGYWTEVNCKWLNARPAEILALLRSQPRIVERLLALITTSSVADLLFSIVQCEELPAGTGTVDWLASEHLVQRLVSLLSPVYTPETHAISAEFLKTLIVFSSNAAANAANAELAAAAEASSSDHPPQQQQNNVARDAQGNIRWASNRLIRELAAEDTVASLMGFILDESPIPEDLLTEQAQQRRMSSPVNSPSPVGSAKSSPRSVTRTLKGKERERDDDTIRMTPTSPIRIVSPTPSPVARPSASPASSIKSSKSGKLRSIARVKQFFIPRSIVAAPSPLTPVAPPAVSPDIEQDFEQTPVPETRKTISPARPSLTHQVSFVAESIPDAARATSSLTHSISVLVDLIRKNNSDFTEGQILTHLKKRASKGESEQIDNLERFRGADKRSPTGPSVVHLGNLLRVVSARLPDLQKLLRYPRSLVGTVDTTLGAVYPFTLERYRITELYAELLHCSNMKLMNRSLDADPQYEDDGQLVGGLDGLEALEATLAASAPRKEAAPAAKVVTKPADGASSSEQDSFDEMVDASENVSLDSPLSSTSSSPRHSRADIRAMLLLNPNLAEAAISISKTSSERDSNHNDSDSPELSTSSTPSMDSESGILTKEEARQLREILAQSASNDLSDSPDLRQAMESLQLNGDLSIPPSRKRSRANGDLMQNQPTDNVRDLERAIPPGIDLKAKLLEHGVLKLMVDLFFTFPWNNLLHNSVYDMLQQIFLSPMDQPHTLRLCMAVFEQADLCTCILQGVELNDEVLRYPKGSRLGYMGHITLIVDDILRLFERHPEVAQDVAPFVPQPAWDRFISTTHRETRDRDLQSLGGGISQALAQAASTPSDTDIELQDVGVKRTERPSRENENDDINSLGLRKVSLDNGSPNAGKDRAFASYLASQMSDGQGDADSDDQSAWPIDRFDKQPSYGFDDRFDSFDGKAILSQAHTVSDSDESDDEAWDPFSDAKAINLDKKHTSSPASHRSPLTVADYNAEFKSSFNDNFATSAPASSSHDDEDDEFGDFEAADDSSFGDYDFTVDPAESSEATMLGSGKTSDDVRRQYMSSIETEEDIMKPLGPAVRPGTHRTHSGHHLESQVNGHLIQVPLDEFSLKTQ